jgi:hypothetical protein
MNAEKRRLADMITERIENGTSIPYQMVLLQLLLSMSELVLIRLDNRITEEYNIILRREGYEEYKHGIGGDIRDSFHNYSRYLRMAQIEYQRVLAGWVERTTYGAGVKAGDDFRVHANELVQWVMRLISVAWTDEEKVKWTTILQNLESSSHRKDGIPYKGYFGDGDYEYFRLR